MSTPILAIHLFDGEYNISTILVGVKWYLIMVLICISQVTNVEHFFFICFLAICIPSLEEFILCINPLHIFKLGYLYLFAIIKSSLHILDLCITLISKGNLFQKLTQDSPHKLPLNFVTCLWQKQSQARGTGSPGLVLIHFIGLEKGAVSTQAYDCAE